MPIEFDSISLVPDPVFFLPFIRAIRVLALK
jgi:hypothetical protein